MTNEQIIRILYVEDDEGLVRLMQRRLRRQGYEVISAPDGEAGIEAYQNEQFDVLVLDQVLPGKSGLDVLRELNDAGNLIPTIMLTGGGNEKVAVESLKLGAKDYIVKDIDGGYIDLMPSVIERMLKNHYLEEEKRQAELALRESEQRNRELVQNSLGIILSHDLDGRIQSINPAAAELLGFNPAALIGMNLKDLISEPSERFMEGYLNQARNQETGEGLMYVRTRTQEERVLMYRNSTYHENTPYVLVHALDISERKRREEHLQVMFEHEKQLNEFRTRLVTTLSHEFRTPMTIISTLTEILKRFRVKLSGDKIQSHLETILQQVHSLDTILTDVLFMYENEAVGINLQPRWVDLVDICKETIEPLRMSSETSHQIELHTIGTPQQAYLDLRLIQRVINNLLSNAIKYSPDGGEITVELEYTDEHVTIHVCDEGIGIPAEDIEHIFDLFHRAGNIGNIGGTGIGMSIVKNTVELHHGTITVDSTEHKGTRVSVRLPIVVPMPSD